MNSTDFREKIKDRLEECKLSQNAVCKRAGVNPGNFSRWLNARDTGKISTDKLESIADVLNLDLEPYDECPED